MIKTSKASALLAGAAALALAAAPALADSNKSSSAKSASGNAGSGKSGSSGSGNSKSDDSGSDDSKSGKSSSDASSGKSGASDVGGSDKSSSAASSAKSGKSEGSDSGKSSSDDAPGKSGTSSPGSGSSGSGGGSGASSPPVVTPISSYAGAGNPALDAGCNLDLTFKCHFTGNITLENLGLVEQAYNAQPGVAAIDLDGQPRTGELEGGAGLYAGSVMANFLVSYYAVKAGAQFELYKLAHPSSSFAWSTADLLVGAGAHPALSHLIWLGAPAPMVPPPGLPPVILPPVILPPPPLPCLSNCGGPLAPLGGGTQFAVPEPRTWALMILGFGAVGAALRRRRRVAA